MSIPKRPDRKDIDQAVAVLAPKKIKELLKAEECLVPGAITTILVELTEFRRKYHDDDKTLLVCLECMIEAKVPGYRVEWNSDIWSYGLVPSSLLDSIGESR